MIISSLFDLGISNLPVVLARTEHPVILRRYPVNGTRCA
jgi:hypothetical protein